MQPTVVSSFTAKANHERDRVPGRVPSARVGGGPGLAAFLGERRRVAAILSDCRRAAG